MLDHQSSHSLEYEIENHVWTEELAPGYPLIHLSNSHGTASVALHGAHVVSYTPDRQNPVIFTSKEAIFLEGKAIRGGIPICLPWFNAHPSDPSLPAHGFARNQFWSIKRSEHKCDESEETSISLELNQNQLQVIATITLGKSLSVSVKSTNLAEENQTVGGALHSYFQVSAIDKTTISGLDNVQYIDTLTHTNEVQHGEIIIAEETDRIYIDTPDTVSIYDADWNRTIFIDKIGSKSTVVWNPWIDKSAGMSDLGNEEYKTFVCVETANAGEDIYQLAKGESHTLGTQITVV